MWVHQLESKSFCSVFLRARQFYHQIQYFSFLHITTLLTSLHFRTHHSEMCGCFQSVSNTVGTHISGRNERPGLSQQLHEGYCVPLVKGLACKRQCSCLLPSWLSLFPCGSPVSEQSLVSCQLEVWVVVSLEPQSYQNWSVPPLSLMVF